MEKDIDRIAKNADTDIVIRVDDFGGKRGVTIREFVKSERYTGFTKAGTRIPVEQFLKFREAINSIDVQELTAGIQEQSSLNNSSSGHKAEHSSAVPSADKTTEGRTERGAERALNKSSGQKSSEKKEKKENKVEDFGIEEQEF